MNSFLASRGCVYRVPGDSSKKGMYNVQANGVDMGHDTGNTPVLISGVQVEERDIVAPVITLGSKKFLFVFGQGFGELSVMGQILLGPDGATTDGIRILSEFFEANRISNPAIQKQEDGPTISISMPGKVAYKSYLVGVMYSPPDAETHIMPFALACLIADPPKGS